MALLILTLFRKMIAKIPRFFGRKIGIQFFDEKYLIFKIVFIIKLVFREENC